jgi:hypothetical protein
MHGVNQRQAAWIKGELSVGLPSAHRMTKHHSTHTQIELQFFLSQAKPLKPPTSHPTPIKQKANKQN